MAVSIAISTLVPYSFSCPFPNPTQDCTVNHFSVIKGFFFFFFLKILVVVVIWSLNGVQLFVNPWTIAQQAPQSMRFSKQECWTGLQFPSPGDLPDPGIEPGFLVSPALTGGLFTAESPGKRNRYCLITVRAKWPLGSVSPK